MLAEIERKILAAHGLAGDAPAEASAKALADAVAPYAFKNYSDERANMQQAAALAPGLAQADYADIAALGDVGSQRQAQTQAELADQVNRWNFNQNRDAARLAQYLQMVQGNFGGTTTTSQTVQAAEQPSGPVWLQAFRGLLSGSSGLLSLL